MNYLYTIFVLFIGLISSASHHKQGNRERDEIRENRHEFHAKGLKRSVKSHGRMMAIRHVSYVRNEVPIPGSIDLSAQVSLPENQGECGDCWNFALTKALRSEYMIAGNDPGVLEFNFLLNNCGKGPEQMGCNGGDFPAALSFENSGGPGLDSQNPYKGVFGGTCEYLPVKATAVTAVMLGTNNNGPTFKDIAYAIGVGRHVLSIDVAAGQGEWEQYRPGMYPNDIYDGCVGGVNDIDHMLNAVGYSCQASVDTHGNCVFDNFGNTAHGDGYILVMNNWGDVDWGIKASNGHRGYMKTVMYGKNGKKCNAIANDALMFTISSRPIPLTPEVTGLLCKEIHWLPWCK